MIVYPNYYSVTCFWENLDIVGNMDNFGKDGNENHLDIIEWTGSNLACYFRTIMPDSKWMFIYDQCMMTYALGYIPQWQHKDLQFPDGLWICDGHVCILEIGKYNPSKWPSHIQCIHIGFNGLVTGVNLRTDVWLLIREEVECIIQMGQLESDRLFDVNTALLFYS